MFGESRMGCRNDAKAHLAPPNRLLQQCNGHFDLRIVCCSDVTVISTPEWDRTRKNYALGYSQSQL